MASLSIGVSIGEWIQANFCIPSREYEQLAGRFNPTAFNADEWVALAKSAGMRYLVFTAKHHDGFALYGSKVDPYNIVDATPFGRDPLAELAQACRKHGMRLDFTIPRILIGIILTAAIRARHSPGTTA